MGATKVSLKLVPLRVPADVAALHSLGFVRRLVRGRHPSLLEVGCGDGRLAFTLAAAGFRVTAIDTDSRGVARAARRGVSAICADFLGWSNGEFDVILFSRSLHHIRPLREAVRLAADLLAPGGRLLVEDFAVDGLDQATAAWRYASEGLLQAAGLLHGTAAPGAALRPLPRWRREHRGVPGEAVLRRALSRHFAIQEEAVPYLYRYAIERLRPGARSVRLAQALLRSEEALVRAGTIRPVGRRWLATRQGAADSREKLQ